jgi:hypothetical protein
MITVLITSLPTAKTATALVQTDSVVQVQAVEHINRCVTVTLPPFLRPAIL